MNQTLAAEFVKYYPSGFTVRFALNQPIDGFHSTVLFGPSGSGKTTALRCLAGLERPQHGSITWGNQTWFDRATKTNLRPQERGIGYLFQDYALFPHLTVEQNIAFGLKASRNERKRRVMELLAAFDISGLESRYPRQLSAGQQQRVALARAVAPHPKLLLLDEPLSALDAPTRQTLRHELRRILMQLNTPTIFVTHDPLEAVALADQAIVMHQGILRQAGPVDQVFSRPSDLTVAKIVGVETVAPGMVVGVNDGIAQVRIGKTDVFAIANAIAPGPVHLCIRGEDVALESQSSGAGSARNRLAGIVIALEPEGATMRVVVECGFRLTALVTRPAVEQLNLEMGRKIIAVIKASAIHLVPR